MGISELVAPAAAGTRHQLAVHASGEVYTLETVDATLVVRRHDATGRRVGFGPAGSDVVLPASGGESPELSRLVVDRSGNVFVGLVRANPSSLFGAPPFVARGGGLYRITPGGELSVVRAAASGTNAFAPADLHLDDAGHLYYLDLSDRKIHRQAADGSRAVVAPGVPSDPAQSPARMAVSPSGKLWAIDRAAGSLLAWNDVDAWTVTSPLLVRDLVARATSPVADAAGNLFFLSEGRLIRRVPSGANMVVLAGARDATGAVRPIVPGPLPGGIGPAEGLAMGPDGVLYLLSGGSILRVRVN